MVETAAYCLKHVAKRLRTYKEIPPRFTPSPFCKGNNILD